MKELNIEMNSPEDMIELGNIIGSLLTENMVITLEGDLGAGKTTLTKGIAKGLGIDGVVNSPTFTIMKIHTGRLKLFHMDVYRINNNSGDDYLEEYFEASGVCVIEWAGNIDSFLPNEKLNLVITTIDENKRNVHFSATKEYEDLLERIHNSI